MAHAGTNPVNITDVCSRGTRAALAADDHGCLLLLGDNARDFRSTRTFCIKLISSKVPYNSSFGPQVRAAPLMGFSDAVLGGSPKRIKHNSYLAFGVDADNSYKGF